MSAMKSLFERGSHMTSASDRDEGLEEDVWDDRKLNDAYDKALKIANAEVAKRVAMSTNTEHPKCEDSKKVKKTKDKQPESSQPKTKADWKAGMACRTVYEEDGLEYEAFVIRIINDNECIVRYLGYENCELVSLDSLLPSLGKKERKKQMEQAAREKSEEPPNLEWRDLDSDRAPSPGTTEYSYERKQKSPRKKKSQKQAHSDQMPDMPFPMPNLSMMPNLSAMPNFGMMPNLSSLDLPMPPPPPMALPQERINSEDQALSSMLLSWYMSGYYTGLYQGMKRAKQSRRRV